MDRESKLYLMTALSRAGYQVVNVAHRSQCRRDAARPQHAQFPPLLRGERRSPTPGEAIVRRVRQVEAQAADQRRAEHGSSRLLRSVV